MHLLHSVGLWDQKWLSQGCLKLHNSGEDRHDLSSAESTMLKTRLSCVCFCLLQGMAPSQDHTASPAAADTFLASSQTGGT